VYRQLADWIAAEIGAGNLEQGAQIPAERRLAELVGVSVDTVRAAMAALRDDGLVETGHGAGTFVKLLQQWGHFRDLAQFHGAADRASYLLAAGACSVVVRQVNTDPAWRGAKESKLACR
jgi:DNA-binding GntR family transcriptional regulator